MEQRERKYSPYFLPIDISGVFNRDIDKPSFDECSEKMSGLRDAIPSGFAVIRGIPFEFGSRNGKNNVFLLKDKPVTFTLRQPLEGFRYLVFVHASDISRMETADDGLPRPMPGDKGLWDEIAEYGLEYEDGAIYSVKMRRRFNINDCSIDWGNEAFEAVPCDKPLSLATTTEEINTDGMSRNGWGQSQTRVTSGDRYDPALWLYAMINPHPSKRIKSIEFLPLKGVALIAGITGCTLETNPLRWESRKKAVLVLNEVENNGDGVVPGRNITIDLGQIISVKPALDYDNKCWEEGYNNKQPLVSKNCFIIEYTAHPKANIYLGKELETVISVCELQNLKLGQEWEADDAEIHVLPVANKSVTVKVKEKGAGRTIPVKIHIHGASGEYLPPVDRHRIPNPFWFEDYSADFVHGSHLCTYIDGEAVYRLPLGEIFIEVSKGFEIKPVRKRFVVDGSADEIVIELEHILPWREKGWVTADTHVHFLSPVTALLEGEAEGVNIVNLLASQWGELFTNIGDFDGKTVHGSRENGGGGEFLVCVGTENRQHVLGHISLLGYEGRMILPLTTGGPDESALGDPIEETLCGWAKRCRQQNGIVILPHFPNPKAEGAAAIVSGLIDGVEMTSWGDLYSGINPYSLSDWYRYLNCGYNVPAVGGTDKMSAATAVGTVRTYARINGLFSFENWKEAVRKAHTFVTYGPLLDFKVEGADMGSKLQIQRGGTLQAEWSVSTVTIPVTKVELVVNGETREVCCVEPGRKDYSGSWPVKVDHNCWIALRVRGRQPGRQEMIAAHSSAIMVNLPGEQCFSVVDAMTILEQIEGVTAYVRTLGTKAEEKIYKELIMTLTSAHRTLHNRMHNMGVYHDHTVLDDHHNR